MRGTTETRTFLNRRKKRENIRKERRLKHEQKQNHLTRTFNAMRKDLNVIMVKGEEEVVIGLRRGLFGHVNAPILRLSHEEIVGAVEEKEGTELGAMLTKLGVLAMACMLGHNLAFGTDGLAKSLAKFAGIDLKALEGAASKETNDFNSGVRPGDEQSGSGQGDYPLRGDSEQQAEAAPGDSDGRDQPRVEEGEAGERPGDGGADSEGPR